MYTHQESNTKLKRTREKPFTQASVLTIRPPGRYTRTKLMKYHRLGGFTCAQFLFWESQCGGELGQLQSMPWWNPPSQGSSDPWSSNYTAILGTVSCIVTDHEVAAPKLEQSFSSFLHPCLTQFECSDGVGPPTSHCHICPYLIFAVIKWYTERYLLNVREVYPWRQIHSNHYLPQ